MCQREGPTSARCDVSTDYDSESSTYSCTRAPSFGRGTILMSQGANYVTQNVSRYIRCKTLSIYGVSRRFNNVHRYERKQIPIGINPTNRQTRASGSIWLSYPFHIVLMKRGSGSSGVETKHTDSHPWLQSPCEENDREPRRTL